VEGLALELARYLRFLTGAGVGVRRRVMCGGGAAGQVTPQIVADVTGVEVACCSEPDTSALGAAVIARGLVDRDAGLAELSQAMAPPLRVVEPGPHSAFYHELLEEYLASLPLVREGAPA
jgi:xylulokinase